MTSFDLDILRQPDDTTCGPTSLHAVYKHFGDSVPLDRVIEEAPSLEDGGTLAVLRGTHALRRGYTATIFTYNVQLFDPTWFGDDVSLVAKLSAQRARKARNAKLVEATHAYVEFLNGGGRVLYRELTPHLIASYVSRRVPLLTGLSATYLYGSRRELRDSTPDDVGGAPVGHFVILCGHRGDPPEILVADPWQPDSSSGGARYWVAFDRLVAAVMLGVVTYDANLLVIEPKEGVP